RAALLRHRVAAHQLGTAAVALRECGVLGAGVRDNPMGVTASVSLRARGIDADEADAELVCAYSIRSALHVHRRDDLSRLRAALRWSVGDEPAEQTYGAVVSGDGQDVQETVDHVVRAMRDAMSDATPRTKGELSTAVTGRVVPGDAPWCPSCEVQHVNDALFRYATLFAGLVAVAGQGRSFRLHPIDEGSAEPAPDTARSELLRRYLHLAGAATPAQLATWVGVSRPAAKRWWSLLDDELTPVRVDGTRMWSLSADLESLSASAHDHDAIHLLPAYDPYTEIADRKQLVPASEQRRKVWRAVRNPGVVLRAGEIAGIWRDRRDGSGRSVTIEPFEPLTAKQRRTAADATETLLHPTPVNLTFA
ncbi:MAG: winged helix DNA-binding domain-containing protein, partial [Actinomycetia bacterium]|nr:winged helix DNA-binding domain-containing protein [Actinomycetes bacterium]